MYISVLTFASVVFDCGGTKHIWVTWPPLGDNRRGSKGRRQRWVKWKREDDGSAQDPPSQTPPTPPPLRSHKAQASSFCLVQSRTIDKHKGEKEISVALCLNWGKHEPLNVAGLMFVWEHQWQWAVIWAVSAGGSVTGDWGPLAVTRVAISHGGSVRHSCHSVAVTRVAISHGGSVRHSYHSFTQDVTQKYVCWELKQTWQWGLQN